MKPDNRQNEKNSVILKSPPINQHKDNSKGTKYFKRKKPLPAKKLIKEYEEEEE